MESDMSDPLLVHWTSSSSDSMLYVATTNGSVAGCIGYRVSGNAMELHRVYVDSRFRRKGIAGKLVDKILGEDAKERGVRQG